MSAKYNITCEQAATFNLQFTVSTDNVLWDITDYSITMTVRPFLGSTTTTIVASTDNGRIAVEGPEGRVTVTIDAATTASFTPANYVYDLVFDSGSTVTRILEGKFIVIGGVTV